MSCLTTSATRRSRSVTAAVLIASAAASSHDVPLVPMISVTLYTLITLSLRGLAAQTLRSTCGPRPADHQAWDQQVQPPPTDLSLALGTRGVQGRCPADPRARCEVTTPD